MTERRLRTGFVLCFPMLMPQYVHSRIPKGTTALVRLTHHIAITYLKLYDSFLSAYWKKANGRWSSGSQFSQSSGICHAELLEIKPINSLFFFIPPSNSELKGSTEAGVGASLRHDRFHPRQAFVGQIEFVVVPKQRGVEITRYWDLADILLLFWKRIFFFEL